MMMVVFDFKSNYGGTFGGYHFLYFAMLMNLKMITSMMMIAIMNTVMMMMLEFCFKTTSGDTILVKPYFGLKTTCGGAIGGRHLLSPTSTS